MADMMDTLRGFLGDNADEKIKNVMTMLQNSGMLSQNGANQQRQQAQNSQQSTNSQATQQSNTSTPNASQQNNNSATGSGQQVGSSGSTVGEQHKTDVVIDNLIGSISGTNQQATENQQSVGSQSGSQGSGEQPMLNAESLQYMMQIKNIIDQMSKSNDSRSNLLRSLRPYMRTDRQRSIDRAIRLMNLSKFSGLFRK